MMYVYETLAPARLLAAFCSGVGVDIGSTIIFSGWPGVARRQPTFFASPKKVSKERRPQVRRPYGLPCAAHKRGPLRKSGSWLRWRKWFRSVLALRQSSRTTPRSLRFWETAASVSRSAGVDVRRDINETPASLATLMGTRVVTRRL